MSRSTRHTETVVVGAGQAGLAISRHLTLRGHDHVILERGRIGERWRSERWDSLRLLTPNWLNHLPGFGYRGDDRHGFLDGHGVVRFLGDYAASFSPPVEEETPVLAVSPSITGWRVATPHVVWHAMNVVIATGACDVPYVPSISQGLALDVAQITPNRYRNPSSLPPGGVLVVGASATGVQLADELRRDGREVTLAVGQHSRLPRRYRGRDVFWWLSRTGALDRDIAEMRDPEAARREPSLQLVGRDTSDSLDLGILERRGIRLAGRLVGADGHRVRFSGDLAATAAEADARLERLLGRIDSHAVDHGLDVEPAEPFAPIEVGAGPSELDLGAAGIQSVLWATGFRRLYPWLDVPGILDSRGEIRHRRGRTPAPGLYVLGMPFMTRRMSPFIGGVGRDAREIADQIAPPAADLSSPDLEIAA